MPPRKFLSPWITKPGTFQVSPSIEFPPRICLVPRVSTTNFPFALFRGSCADSRRGLFLPPRCFSNEFDQLKRQKKKWIKIIFVKGVVDLSPNASFQICKYGGVYPSRNAARVSCIDTRGLLVYARLLRGRRGPPRYRANPCTTRSKNLRRSLAYAYAWRSSVCANTRAGRGCNVGWEITANQREEETYPASARFPSAGMRRFLQEFRHGDESLCPRNGRRFVESYVRSTRNFGVHANFNLPFCCLVYYGMQGSSGISLIIALLRIRDTWKYFP